MSPPETTSLTTTARSTSIAGLESVLLSGDLRYLNEEQRLSYYARVCESVGLNPLTQPFEYLTLNGKTILYARRACTDQLRHIHHVSIQIVARELVEGCWNVTARATMPSGRTDESMGSVNVQGLKGEALSNAFMKAETKAKRRVTLAICGLSTLDESELDGIQGARSAPQAPPRDAFPLASAPEAPQAPRSAPEATERRPAVVLPFQAAQDPVAKTALELFGPKLRARKTAEELIDWMRQVSAANFSVEVQRALWRLFEQHCREGCRPPHDPTVLRALSKQKGGA